MKNTYFQFKLCSNRSISSKYWSITLIPFIKNYNKKIFCESNTFNFRETSRSLYVYLNECRDYIKQEQSGSYKMCELA